MPRPRLEKDIRVLDAIKTYQAEYGFAPTIEELRKALKVGSGRTIYRYLTSLENKGLIKRWHGARGIQLMDGTQFIELSVEADKVWTEMHMSGVKLAIEAAFSSEITDTMCISDIAIKDDKVLLKWSKKIPMAEGG